MPELIKTFLIIMLSTTKYSKIKIWFQDETRIGLFTVQRRKITIKGVKPKGIAQNVFKSFYVYGLIEPMTGETFFYTMDYFNGDCFGLFLDEFAKQQEELFSDTINIIILDNAAAHKKKSIKQYDNIKFLFLPPYSPELNPVERFWLAFKNKFAWNTYDSLESLKSHSYLVLNSFSSSFVHSLCFYSYIKNSVICL